VTCHLIRKKNSFVGHRFVRIILLLKRSRDRDNFGAGGGKAASTGRETTERFLQTRFEACRGPGGRGRVRRGRRHAAFAPPTITDQRTNPSSIQLMRKIGPRRLAGAPVVGRDSRWAGFEPDQAGRLFSICTGGRGALFLCASAAKVFECVEGGNDSGRQTAVSASNGGRHSGLSAGICGRNLHCGAAYLGLAAAGTSNRLERNAFDAAAAQPSQYRRAHPRTSLSVGGQIRRHKASRDQCHLDRRQRGCVCRSRLFERAPSAAIATGRGVSDADGTAAGDVRAGVSPPGNPRRKEALGTGRPTFHAAFRKWLVSSRFLHHHQRIGRRGRF